MPPPLIPPHLPPHRLLLVDDDPTLRETLTDILQAERFDVTAAASGEAAEELIAKATVPFDLVLTDLVMPGKGGMEVLHCALKRNPSCTVLVLSGFGSTREATEAMDAGAYGMVPKPLYLDQFRNTLRRIMERIDLIGERDTLRQRVKRLERQVEALETTQGRMEMLAQRITPSGPTGPVSNPMEDLERLARLRTQALLTEEQFESAKKALFSRWLP